MTSESRKSSVVSSMDSVLQVKRPDGDRVAQPGDHTLLGKTNVENRAPDSHVRTAVVHQEITHGGIITKLLTPHNAVIQVLTPEETLVDPVKDVQRETTAFLLSERGITHADGVSEITLDEGYSTVPDWHDDTVAEYQKEVISSDGLDEGEITQGGQEEATLIDPDNISLEFAAPEKVTMSCR